MKKIIILVSLFVFGCLFTGAKGKETIKTHAFINLQNGYAIQTMQQAQSATDSVIALLLYPHIDKAINDYFGEPTQYALYDAQIKSITQAGTDFIFQVVITVPTFHGAHNPPYGLETMTFTIKPGGVVILDNYEHKNI